jgi:signal transduction histidine kinase
LVHDKKLTPSSPEYQEQLTKVDDAYALFASAVDNLKGKSFSFILEYKAAGTGKEPLLDNIKSHYMFLLAYTKQIDATLEEGSGWSRETAEYAFEQNDEVLQHSELLSTLANQKISQYLSERQDKLVIVEQYVTALFGMCIFFILMFGAVVIHYVLRLKKASESLKHANLNLEMARDEVFEAFQSKSSFVAKFSHEARTPLNSIMGFAQIMDEDPTNPLNATQKENLGYVMNSAKHLLALLNEILDYSRLEAGKIEVKCTSFSMHSVIDDVRYMLKKELQAHNNTIQIQLPEQVWVHADILRFKQVLINLVSNAIKYGYAGTPILVNVALHDEDTVIIAIRNEGDTIPESEIKNIFSPYYRGKHENGGIQGYGIGLNLSRKFVEMMDGTITCESINNHTTFYIAIKGGKESVANQTNEEHTILETQYIMLVSNHERYIEEVRKALMPFPHLSLILADNQEYAQDILSYMQVPIVLYTKDISNEEWVAFTDKNKIASYLIEFYSEQPQNALTLEKLNTLIRNYAESAL